LIHVKPRHERRSILNQRQHRRRNAGSHAAQEARMSVAKVIEISAESTKSFEDAISHGVKIAAKSVRGIKSAWVKEQKVIVSGDAVSRYRVDLMVTFVLE
jgi:hypothetical protein